MCLNETRSRDRADKYLFDMFPLKNGLRKGGALLRLFLNFVLEYAIRRAQVNQNVLKLKGTDQALVYADDVNTLSGSLRTIKKITEALVVASHDIGLELNTDETKYMVISRDLNAERCKNIKFDNNFLKGWKSSNI